MVDPVGKIDSDGNVNLHDIRKPGFFGKAPYNERVAEADSRTHVVEFTVPRDPLERLKLSMPGDIKLRGWYVEGAGVDDGRGGRTSRPRHHERGRWRRSSPRSSIRRTCP